jgi:hypothetical protein
LVYVHIVCKSVTSVIYPYYSKRRVRMRIGFRGYVQVFNLATLQLLN